MTEVQFRVLGPLGLSVGGRGVPVAGTRPRRLLACLVMHVGRPVPVPTLVDAVWGAERPPDPARIQPHASRLRAVLAPVRIDRAADGYLLRAEPATVDAHRFDHLVARARSSGPSEEALRLLDEAANLWHGDPYLDLADFEPATAEALRLAELRAGCQEQRAANLLALGDPTGAIADLRALTTAHPLRERSWQLLMLALHRTGRQAEALSAFREYDDALAEVGLEPSTATTELRSAILTDPESVRHGSWPVEPARTAPIVVPAPPRRLDELLESVRAAVDDSYVALPAAVARAFRLLGLVPWPDLSVAAVAALIAEPVPVASGVLHQLAAAHLCTQRAPGRYACHQLVRCYAAERATNDDPAEVRIAALTRLLDWYLACADAAARLLHPDATRPAFTGPPVPPPPFRDQAGARSWLRAERPNLVAATIHDGRFRPVLDITAG